MDLGAYANIGSLEEIAKRSGIKVPRLRGYRLMRDENPVKLTEEDKEYIRSMTCENLCYSIPFWRSNSGMSEYSSRTKRIKAYYMDGDKIRWDRIHGWKRRVLKTEIHNFESAVKKQYEIFNEYVGREDILYIHARIGGGNWPYYYKEVVNQPWFIEKVDDAWDSTYCDIYARMKGEEDETD